MSSFDSYLAATANLQPLDEAFFGKTKIKPMQAAMDAIYAKIKKDPKFKIQNSKEGNALEAAIAKIFGFKRCTIYWRYYDMSGVYTLGNMALARATNIAVDTSGFYNHTAYTMPSIVLFPDNSAKSPTKYGTVKNGFYDESHTMICVINIDQQFVTRGVLTSEELVAALLHEIGHNFDNTMFRLISNWEMIAGYLIDIVNRCRVHNYDPKACIIYGGGGVLQLAAEVTLNKIAPEIHLFINHIDDILLSAIPIEKILKPITTGANEVMRFLQAITMPWTVMYGINLLKSLPAKIVSMTIGNAASLVYRYTVGYKLETYADSFAAQYGYGAELTTALHKLSLDDNKVDALKDTKVEPIMKPFYDLICLEHEILSLLDISGHGSLAERYQRLINTLDQDLRESGLSDKDRKVIMAERDRLVKTYEKCNNMLLEDRQYVSYLYEKLVHAWSGGKIAKAISDKTYKVSAAH